LQGFFAADGDSFEIVEGQYQPLSDGPRELKTRVAKFAEVFDAEELSAQEATALLHDSQAAEPSCAPVARATSRTQEA
jgi:hypothetical protein